MIRMHVLVLGGLLALAGCLEARSTTVLRADGSGTYREIVVVDLVKAAGYQEALKKQMQSMPPGDDPDLGDPFDNLDVEKRTATLERRKGIRITSHSESKDESKKTRLFELGVDYTSLRSLYEAGVVEDVAVSLVRAEDGKSWTLTIRHIFDGNERDPDASDPAAMEQLTRLRAGMLARHKTWWGTLRIERTLTLPTAVSKTNGTKAEDGRTVTWTVGFDDLADPRRLRQEVTFAHSDELKLEPFELTANDIANAKELADLAAEEAARAGK